MSDEVTQIGQYLVESRIGEGGMGSVYLGRHVHLGMRAAIKTILKKSLAGDESVVRLLDEGRALAKLQHVNIVRVLDFFENEGNFYLVMEYVDGWSLKQRLESGPVEMGEALRIARAVGTGIVAAHSQNILHRDIKPSNVMLGKTDEIKLTDFGLAKFMGATSKTKAGFVIGTPRYMAPETVRGDEVDERSDQYAFGILLYRLLAGREPFLGETPVEIMSAQVNRLPRPPREFNPHIHLQLQDLVMKTLEKDPNARFPSMAKLMVALNHFSKAVITSGQEKSAPVEPPTVALARSLEEALEPTITRGMVQVKLGEGPPLEDFPPEPAVETLHPGAEVRPPPPPAPPKSPYAPRPGEKPVYYYRSESDPPAAAPEEEPSGAWVRRGGLALALLLLAGGVYFAVFRGGDAAPPASAAAPVAAAPAAVSVPHGSAPAPLTARFSLQGTPFSLIVHTDVPAALHPAPAGGGEQMLLMQFAAGSPRELRDMINDDGTLAHRDFYLAWLALKSGQLNDCIQAALRAQTPGSGSEPAGRYLEGSCRLAAGQVNEAAALFEGVPALRGDPGFNAAATMLVAGADADAGRAAERFTALDGDPAAQYLAGRYFLAADPLRGQRLLKKAERLPVSSAEKTEIERWLSAR